MQVVRLGECFFRLAIYGGLHRIRQSRQRPAQSLLTLRVHRSLDCSGGALAPNGNSDYLSSDLLAWLGGGVLHIGLVSDRKATIGVPLVIHKFGAGAREENILFRYAIFGHFRLEAPR